jgi:ACS family hexuronate transporter-like MFS transporter
MNKSGKFRWVICGLLFALVALSYIDRLIIGILKKPIGTQLGWSEVDYGNIAAGFSFAYAFGYLFAGRAMDRLRVKRGLPMFVFVWSLSVAAHGLISFIGKDAVWRLQYPWFSFAEKGFQWMTLAMPGLPGKALSPGPPNDGVLDGSVLRADGHWGHCGRLASGRPAQPRLAA